MYPILLIRYDVKNQKWTRLRTRSDQDSETVTPTYTTIVIAHRPSPLNFGHNYKQVAKKMKG